jgi:hypothetical protein
LHHDEAAQTLPLIPSKGVAIRAVVAKVLPGGLPTPLGQLALAGVLAVAAPASCARSGSDFPPTGGAGPPQAFVANVAGQVISAEDVAVQMRRFHVDARTALQQLVTFELLARAATAAGVAATDTGVDDRQRLRSVEIQRLIEREIEPRLAKTAISDTDVRALYERGKSRFVHGRLVQVAVLCVFTGARLKPEPRARAEANARALKAFVDQQGDRTPAAFEGIAAKPEWAERNVSFTTVWQGESDPFPAVVGRAVAALSKPGQTTDLVGDETGYYIARYIAERPPENVSFAEAAPALRDEMFEPWRRQRFIQLTMAMSNGHDIEVFPDAVKLLKGD